MSFKIIFTSDGEYHALDQVREVMPEAVFPCFKAGLLRQAADPLKLAQPANPRARFATGHHTRVMHTMNARNIKATPSSPPKIGP